MGRSEHPLTPNQGHVMRRPPSFETYDPKPAIARTMGAMQTADDTGGEKPGIGHAIQALGGIQSKPPVSATRGVDGGSGTSGGAGTGFTWNTGTASPMYQGSPGVGAMTPAPASVAATWQGGPKPMTTAGGQPGMQPPESFGVDQPEVPSESLENAPRSGFRQKAIGRE